MNYEQASAWLESLESLGIQPGLERIAALLARLGRPEQRLPAVIVAGTNGKGSVVAFLSAMLRSTGLRPGVYTSPHLVRFEERIRVGDAPIPPGELATLTAEIREAAEGVRRDGGAPPTYFEATTALAFLHFARRRVPIALLEVGMGGRFDATNVVAPLATAITPVSLDHTQWLGGTVAEIAYQKAGILKAGVPAAVARQAPEAMRVIVEEAARVGAPLLKADRCSVTPAAGAHDPPRFALVTPSGGRYDGLALSLRGDHQVGNAVVAVLLAESLRARGGPALGAADIAHGLLHADWPGRLELVRDPAGDGGADLLLDGAHNPDGCAILAAYLERHQAARRRRALLFAAMRDKPAAEMLRLLKPVVDAVVLTTLGVPRGAPPADLERAAAAAGLEAASEPDPRAALARVLGLAGPGGLAIASGSLYLVGAIRRAIGRG